MNPKIAIIVSRRGIDSVTVLSSGTEARNKAYKLFSIIEEEINKFEINFVRKIHCEVNENGQEKER